VNDQKHVGSAECRDMAVFRDDRLKEGDGVLCRYVLKGDDPGYVCFVYRDFILVSVKFCTRLLGSGCRDYLVNLSGLDQGDSLKFQYGGEYIESLFVREFCRRVDRDLSLNFFIHDKVLAGEITYELYHGRDIYVGEVEYHP